MAINNICAQGTCKYNVAGRCTLPTGSIIKVSNLSKCSKYIRR